MSSAILLIGPRGAGKTTVGRLLASSLKLAFIDLDDTALALTGANSIQVVFETAGEAAWRQAEAAALESSLTGGDVVIATGGGVACIDPAMHVLHAARVAKQAVTVWLRCSDAVLHDRLATNIGDRPSLTGRDPIEEAVDVASGRLERYAAAADFEIQADGPAAVVAADIVTRLSRS